tara:strand:+ start:4497 stop:5846 length:1350 start_codon:yes stop_codon:yes gene_type:complete
MPKKKFGLDDKFFNVIKAYPKYTFSYYFNQRYINNRQNQGNRVQSGSVSLFELNVDREQGSDLIYPFFTKGENSLDFSFKNLTGSLTNPEYNKLAIGTEITSSYPLTSSIGRDLLIGTGSTNFSSFVLLDGVAKENSIRKIVALENVLNYNKVYSPKFDFEEYYINGGVNRSWDGANIEDIAAPLQKYMTMFTIPEIFKGKEVKPGSVELNFYITGTLIGTAKDSNRNGELIETHGPRSGGSIGTISYSEGIMILTGNYNLSSIVEDGYLCPITGTASTTPGPTRTHLQTVWKDKPKWAHFGAYNSFITASDDQVSSSFGPVSSSYELKFKGTNTIPTLTMLCHAEKNEMNWSNNLSYLDRNYATGSNYQKILAAQTASSYYREGRAVPIKNTVSSSFANYSASYVDQTYITKINIFDKDGNIIAIAKTANPVVKNNNMDYTFKLKLDI